MIDSNKKIEPNIPKKEEKKDIVEIPQSKKSIQS